MRLLALLCCFAAPALAQQEAALLGKQRAAESRHEWEVREAGHPVLGNIRFAFLKAPVETAVGGAKVYSRAYVSCQKDARRFAVELTNTVTPYDPGGLQPAVQPKLLCSRPGRDGKLVREPIGATWEVSDIGDAMARGLRAFPLRECVTIDVLQEVTLPAGWSARTAKVQLEIPPYDRELDSIFASCGERSAYAPGTATPVMQAAATTAKPASATPRAEPVAKSEAGWSRARVIPSGKTNVRASPSIKAAIVAELAPGAALLVQRTGTEWWRARAASGTAFEGYVRQDRLTFR